MAKIAVMKDVMKPITKNVNWSWVNGCALLYKSSSVAASIVGTANKNENSTITPLRKSNIKPPMIVTADLETPGMIAMGWKNPMSAACL